MYLLRVFYRFSCRNRDIRAQRAGTVRGAGACKTISTKKPEGGDTVLPSITSPVEDCIHACSDFRDIYSKSMYGTQGGIELLGSNKGTQTETSVNAMLVLLTRESAKSL